jgi:hypothetical protein
MTTSGKRPMSSCDNDAEEKKHKTFCEIDLEDVVENQSYLQEVHTSLSDINLIPVHIPPTYSDKVRYKALAVVLKVNTIIAFQKITDLPASTMTFFIHIYFLLYKYGSSADRIMEEILGALGRNKHQFLTEYTQEAIDAAHMEIGKNKSEQTSPYDKTAKIFSSFVAQFDKTLGFANMRFVKKSTYCATEGPKHLRLMCEPNVLTVYPMYTVEVLDSKKQSNFIPRIEEHALLLKGILSYLDHEVDDFEERFWHSSIGIVKPKNIHEIIVHDDIPQKLSKPEYDVMYVVSNGATLQPDKKNIGKLNTKVYACSIIKFQFDKDTKDEFDAFESMTDIRNILVQQAACT